MFSAAIVAGLWNQCLASAFLPLGDSDQYIPTARLFPACCLSLSARTSPASTLDGLGHPLVERDVVFGLGFKRLCQ